ncbi:MAG TPA: HlyD family efflux transporter periplasmic adaptor subunit [Thermoanaerobaculia bacterium]|nr:HlyD family efflux transporter periplasmic adaptor subunit [Thermoanaerobaculia bacterium]
MPGPRAVALVEEAESGAEPSGRLNIVLAAGDDLSPFQDLIDRDRIFYLTQEPVPAADLAAILRGAANRWRTAQVRSGEERERLALGRRLLAAARDIAAEKKASGAGRAAADAAADLVGAERAWCLFYDPVHETLWAGDEGSPDERRESAAVGLVSFVTRTGRPVSLERLGSDPRFDRDADDPEAAGDERFAVVPVELPAELASSGAPRVLAVITVVRAAEAAPFTERDLETLARLAEQAAPTFAHLLPAAEEAEASGMLSPGLFREQAVEHHRDGLSGEGDLLRADPGWMRWTFRLLVAVVVAGLLFAVLGKIREYAAGPAVIRLGGRTDLTANAAGTVTQVLARPGERVARGRLLVRFYGAAEAAQLERIEREMELQLVNRLRNPNDRGAEQALISLRAQRELARAQLAERDVRAPAAGVVSDIRVRPGQHIAPGQTLLSVAGEQGMPTVVALLPGQYRPLLKPGMQIRLELQGYRYAYQQLTVAAVEDEVIGPTEARRYLGDAVADAVPLDGPVVLVSARLSSPTFEAEGRTWRYHDGMWGRAEVRVRSERILVALIPALKALFEEESRNV